MAAYSTAAPLLSLPVTDGVSITPSGVASTFSAWVELTALASTGMRLANVSVLPGAGALGNFFAVEIGVGPAGSEMAVTEVRGDSGNLPNADFGDVILVAVPADVITAGQRVVARMRQVSTDTTPWIVSLQYWALPIAASSNMPVATVGQVYYPTSGITTSVTAGTSGNFGSAVTISASTDADWMIGNVVCVGPGPNFATWNLQILVDDVVRWTVNSREAWTFIGTAFQGAPWNIVLRPPFLVPSGSKLSVKLRSEFVSQVYGLALGVTKQAVTNCATALPQQWAPEEQIAAIAAPGGFGNYGAWTEWIASTATDILVTGLISTHGNIGGTTIQIGVGGSGDEVSIGECHASYGVGFGGGRFQLPLPSARWVPAGSRVSLRMTISSGGASLGVGLGYLEAATAPDFANWSDDLVQVAYASISMSTHATAWTNGAWVEIDPNVAFARMITAYAWDNPAPVEVCVDIGIGAANSESVVTTVRWASGCGVSSTSFGYMLLPIPARIPSGSRLVARARCSMAGVQTIAFVAHYTAMPVTPPPPEPPEASDYPIVWIRRTPTAISDNKRVFYRLLEPLFSPGVGTANPPGDDPQCALRTSNDGGYTWSSVREAPIGVRGDYSARTRFLQLGSGRRRQFEISGTSRVCIIGANLEADEGDS